MVKRLCRVDTEFPPSQRGSFFGKQRSEGLRGARERPLLGIEGIRKPALRGREGKDPDFAGNLLIEPVNRRGGGHGKMRGVPTGHRQGDAIAAIEAGE